VSDSRVGSRFMANTFSMLPSKREWRNETLPRG
jgi:hypothetical protein